MNIIMEGISNQSVFMDLLTASVEQLLMESLHFKYCWQDMPVGLLFCYRNSKMGFG
jgi:hypothetical protein